MFSELSKVDRISISFGNCKRNSLKLLKCRFYSVCVLFCLSIPHVFNICMNGELFQVDQLTYNAFLNLLGVKMHFWIYFLICCCAEMLLWINFFSP